MKTKQWVKFYSVLVIIIVFVFLALQGFSASMIGIDTSNFKILSAKESKLGIDIMGGAYMLFYPDKNYDINAVTPEQLDASKAVITRRLDSQLLFDAPVTVDKTNKRIIVEIPASGDIKDFNPQTYVDLIGKTSELTFRDVTGLTADAKGNFPATGEIVLKGANVIQSKPELAKDKTWNVALKLNDEGKVSFAAGTSRLVGKQIAIFMDQDMISAPNVQVPITDGQAVITTNSTDPTEANLLASQISSGSLPFKLEPRQVDSVSPLLGKGALNSALFAGMLAALLISLYMILHYRLPGLIATIALSGMVAAQLVIISNFQIALTLPGIAGIILTMGIGVDANVIIYERIKEELRNGKTLRTCIEVGYKKAFTAVLDSNVTTIIVACVLLYFGSGPIKGFAFTLLIGVILSFLSAVTATKIMLVTLGNFNAFKSLWLYGVKARAEQ
jgi:preprotein translocase subunit SecD